MLQLNYVLVSSKELTCVERVRLACKGEEFGAILTDGVLKVNKDLKRPKKLEKIVRQMFAVDHLLDVEEVDLFDSLYQEVKETWSNELFIQLQRAWSTTLGKKMDEEDKQGAAAWREQNPSPDTLGKICELFPAYSHGLVKALYAAGGIDDVFTYGFQMGAQYGKSATT